MSSSTHLSVRSLILCVTFGLASGCVFTVAGIDVDHQDLADTDGGFDASSDDLPDLAGDDLAGIDLSGADLAGMDLAGADLAMPDLSTPDLSMPDFSAPDLLVPLDFSTLPDLTPPPDLTAPLVFPSHVPAHYLDDSKIDWKITSDTTIDTGALTISPAAPSGVVFVADGSFAVLALNKLTLGNDASSSTKVRVIGSRPLVIVAGDSIIINGVLDGGGQGGQAGPAGGAAGIGSGAGGAGAPGTANATGGAGGGYGTSGGAGGARPTTGGGSNAGPVGGVTYGSPILTTLVGGSGGGNGVSTSGNTIFCGDSSPGGGAGGGAIQLSARVSVSVATYHSSFFGAIGGIVSVSGGAGAGGCGASTRTASGAGGGSGGAVLVEAPSVVISGVLGASGGGGGSGGHQNFGTVNGSDGRDGLVYGTQINQSSLGGGTQFGLSQVGGKGANAVVNTGDATAAGAGDNETSSGGGGGGGYGRLYVRSHGAATVAQASPAPVTDTSLPATIP